MTGILLLPPTSGIAFFLIVPFLVIIRRGTVIVVFASTLFVILFIWFRSLCYFNCRSNWWFLWVSRSTTATRICTCLSYALDGILVSWLVVAIDHVRTMQIFVLETAIWLITHSHKRHQLMMHKNCQWVNHSHTCQWMYLKNKREEPSREHRWSVGQRPFKC